MDGSIEVGVVESVTVEGSVVTVMSVSAGLIDVEVAVGSVRASAVGERTSIISAGVLGSVVTGSVVVADTVSVVVEIVESGCELLLTCPVASSAVLLGVSCWFVIHSPEVVFVKPPEMVRQ